MTQEVTELLNYEVKFEKIQKVHRWGERNVYTTRMMGRRRLVLVGCVVAVMLCVAFEGAEAVRLFVYYSSVLYFSIVLVVYLVIVDFVCDL